MIIGRANFEVINNPKEEIMKLKKKGYTACVFPYDYNVKGQLLKDYLEYASREGMIIAEVGAWSNPIDLNSKKKKEAIEYCMGQLDLADEIGALCCVNISGSKGEKWDGHHRLNFSKDTFDEIVYTVREIIDAVKPKRTKYSLEMMPWIYPSTPEEYLKLIKAIDRKSFGVHLDPINIINSPYLYYHQKELIDACVDLLGKHIVSCHIKGIRMEERLTVHIDECPLGQGYLDISAYISALNRLNRKVPLIIEHLNSETAYDEAFKYLKKHID